jgi:peptidase E
VVHDAIDGGQRGRRVFEDAFPLAEDEVGRDAHAVAFVPLAQEREQHLHFVAVVLDVADVIEEDARVPIQLGQQVG